MILRFLIIYVTAKRYVIYSDMPYIIRKMKLHSVHAMWYMIQNICFIHITYDILWDMIYEITWHDMTWHDTERHDTTWYMMHSTGSACLQMNHESEPRWFNIGTLPYRLRELELAFSQNLTQITIVDFIFECFLVVLITCWRNGPNNKPPWH